MLKTTGSTKLVWLYMYLNDVMKSWNLSINNPIQYSTNLFSLQLHVAIASRKTDLALRGDCCCESRATIPADTWSSPTSTAFQMWKDTYTEKKTVYRRLHLPVNAHPQNLFSRDVKRLRFRCQTLKFCCLNVKFYFLTLLKGKMFSINKKGRNYQFQAICGVKSLSNSS